MGANPGRSISWGRKHRIALQVLLAAVLMAGGIAFAQPEHDAAIDAAFAREARLSAGHLVFKLELSDLGRREPKGFMAADVRDTAIIHFYWDGPSQWRTDVVDRDGIVLRSVVYDGTYVDTGGHIWAGE